MAVRREIFDDPFLHMIEEVFPDGRVMRTVGGAHNIFVAARAYEELLKQSSRGTWLVLRERGRIIRHEQATGEALNTPKREGGGPPVPPPLGYVLR